MQTRERSVPGGSIDHTSEGRRSIFVLAPCVASMVIATFLTMSPAKADFVCNAKTKLVNVFLQPPSYWRATPPQDENALAMRDRIEAEERRAARGGVWSPADRVKEPFDLVDTLPSGARVKVHALAESKGWAWISFRHSQNGLVGNGYVHTSRLSPIGCDADPATDLSWMRAGGPDGPGEPDGYRLRLDDYFHSDEDDPPLEGARGAKPFETKALSSAIASSEILYVCKKPPQNHTLPKEITSDAQFLEPYILACTKALVANPNYVEALIIRGDIWHRFAKTPAPGLDNKSPKWAEDIKRRKEAQAKAVADWTRASLLLPRGVPTVLEDRLKPTGPAGYDVK